MTNPEAFWDAFDCANAFGEMGVVYRYHDGRILGGLIEDAGCCEILETIEPEYLVGVTVRCSSCGVTFYASESIGANKGFCHDCASLVDRWMFGIQPYPDEYRRVA